ncbi:MAG: YraN family protein [Bacteroidota bacterium]
MRTAAQRRGTDGEEIARQYLEREGYAILETNFRFLRGEIDIVAEDGEFLVFCEVKSRESGEYGAPEYAITAEKRAKIRKVAEGYLLVNSIREHPCRFDVVTILMDGNRGVLNHMRNAF